jgi:His/Glu/Gln/Arg/opine family amino acid ABC transporter permease subunit
MNFYLYLPLFLQGAFVTIIAWFIVGFFSFWLGLFLGILSCDFLVLIRMRKIISCYTFIARGIPAYVQLLIGYYVLPDLLGISCSAFGTACATLIFCSSGYTTEIIRSGINAISKGQWEAAMALGYTPLRAIRYIILPQVFKLILSPLFGEFEQLLKSTSLFSVIGVAELTFTAQNIVSRELTPLPIYGILGLLYLSCSSFLLWGRRKIEDQVLGAG